MPNEWVVGREIDSSAPAELLEEPGGHAAGRRLTGGVAMGLSSENRDVFGCAGRLERPGFTRRSTRSRPQCEALETLQLLSTAPTAAFLLPGAAEIARAQTVLTSGAGQAFQNYTSELQQVEKASHVTPGQFATLDSDVEQLAQAIETANLPSGTITDQLNQLQDTVDQSFLAASYKSDGWNQVQTQLDNAIEGVSITTNLPGQTYSQMQLIAREAHVTLAEHRQLVADEQAITTALGPHVDTDLGGSSPRDPLVVYYNGQVNQFVHKR